MSKAPDPRGREELPEEAPDEQRRPSPPAERAKSRRDFLTRIGGMTFLSAAVVKLGVNPARAQEPLPRPTEFPIDPYCGKEDPEGGVYEDRDCGKPGSNGDQDCGKSNGLFTHQDNDCVVSGGDGADNDCGKEELFGAVHEDNDCSQGGEDQDCGKMGITDTPDGPTYYEHTDSDGSDG